MFQTLKAQNGALGDLEYVVQSSVPACDKIKAAKKLPACTRCKMKKLKCIVEADSCEKCVEGGVTCSYRGTGGFEARESSSAGSQSNRRSSPTSSDCISVYSKTGPGDERPQSGLSYGDSTNDSSLDHNEMEMCMTVHPDDDPCSNFFDSTMPPPSFIADLSDETPELTQDTHPTNFVNMLDSTLHADGLHDFDLCFCIDLIIAANAIMQVRLVWATSMNTGSTSSIEDMLQCQKSVLASCETFFKCKKCSLKSDYVVLVISMCQAMVNGVKSLEAITSPDAQSSRRQASHLGSGTFSKGKLEAGGWRLEDDEEIEIISHLIQVRITKLRKLVDQLEHIVSTNHASYSWVVGNIKRSLDGKLEPTMSPAGDGMGFFI